MIAIDFSKQESLDVDPKEIQQISFTANLDQDRNLKMFFMFFIVESSRETILDVSQGTVKVL